MSSLSPQKKMKAKTYNAQITLQWLLKCNAALLRFYNDTNPCWPQGREMVQISFLSTLFAFAALEHCIHFRVDDRHLIWLTLRNVSQRHVYLKGTVTWVIFFDTTFLKIPLWKLISMHVLFRYTCSFFMPFTIMVLSQGWNEKVFLLVNRYERYSICNTYPL